MVIVDERQIKKPLPRRLVAVEAISWLVAVRRSSCLASLIANAIIPVFLRQPSTARRTNAWFRLGRGLGLSKRCLS